MANHDLKTHPGPFQAVWERRKPFEVRRADRPFRVDDTVTLREWRPCTCGTSATVPCSELVGYTGRTICARITYIVGPGEWGLPVDLAVLGIDVEARYAP